MNDDAFAAASEGYFGWLDIILAFARNLKWLIVLPIAAGIIAHLASNALPKYYTSAALLRADGNVEADMRSAIVIDEVLKTFSGPENGLDLRRKWLLDKVTLTRLRGPTNKPGDPTPLLMTVTDENPQTAQSIATSIIEAWMKLLKPAGAVAKSLEGQIKQETTELASVDTAIKKLEAELGNGQSAEALVSLYELRKSYTKELLDLSFRLQGPQPDQIIVSAPTLPDDPTKRLKLAGPITAMLVLLVGIGYVLAQALIVFTRANPKSSAKLSRIKAALWGRGT